MNIKDAISQYAIDSIADDYSPVTIMVYTNALKKFADFVGDYTELEDITNRHIKNFNMYLRTSYKGVRMDNPDRLSSASLHRYWKALRSFFKWAKLELDLESPEKYVKAPQYENKEIIPLTHLEVQRLLAALHYTEPIFRSTADRLYQFRLPDPARNKAIILLILDTGIRPAELSRLRVKHLMANSEKIEIIPHRIGKTRARILELSAPTRQAILTYLKSRGALTQDDFLFVTTNGLPMRTNSIGKAIRTIAKRAHVENCFTYRLRHTFAVEYLRNGGDLFTLQYFMGHSNIKTTRRYISFLEQDREHAHKIASPVKNWKL